MRPPKIHPNRSHRKMSYSISNIGNMIGCDHPCCIPVIGELWHFQYFATWRLGIAGSIMAQLDKVWRQQRLSLSTKLRIYTSHVQSVVLYGSETWTMRKVDSDRIQSFHMQALRRILGIRWYDKVYPTQ